MIKNLWKIVFILLIFFVVCKAKDQEQGKTTNNRDFTLTTIDNEEITLSKLKGKVVLIDFWTTWCPPCKNSIPVFTKLYNKFHEQGFIVLGIGLEEKTPLENYRNQHNIPYPILIGNKEVARAYGVQGIPHIVIIDK
ncbi:MAG: TlpA family protein disulfide reductase, partial [Candidatus Stahlbacteria bacterium]